MKSVCVSLDSIEKVKGFVNKMDNVDGDAFLSAGRYAIDAKSIMGIFSMNLAKPLKLEIEKWKDEYETLLAPYLAE